jgi:hypothetical protein
MGAGADQYGAYLPDRLWSLAELRPMIPDRSDRCDAYSIANHVTERIMSRYK